MCHRCILNLFEDTVPKYDLARITSKIDDTSCNELGNRLSRHSNVHQYVTCGFWYCMQGMHDRV